MTKTVTTTAAPLLVNKTHLPHHLDAGLGARLRIGVIVLATEQTAEHEFRRMLALPGVDVYQARIWNETQITPDTLAAMARGIETATRQILPDAPLDVMGFTCTSGAMVIGEDTVFNLMRNVRPGIACSSPIRPGICCALVALPIRCRSGGGCSRCRFAAVGQPVAELRWHLLCSRRGRWLVRRWWSF